MASLFKDEAREVFLEAVRQYLTNVETLLESDVKVPAYNGAVYSTRDNLVGATFASRSFTEEEIEYFYETYDKLWELGGKIEAYCLMRLVFGVFGKRNIEELYRQGHLLNMREIYNYARSGKC